MFKLPELGYNYDAVEPYIDAKTMEIHHSKHHNGFVMNLNSIFEKMGKSHLKDVSSILKIFMIFQMNFKLQ